MSFLHCRNSNDNDNGNDFVSRRLRRRQRHLLLLLLPMKLLPALVLVVALVAAGADGTYAETVEEQPVRVFVGYRTEDGRTKVLEEAAYASSVVAARTYRNLKPEDGDEDDDDDDDDENEATETDFPEIQAVTVRLLPSQVARLRQDPLVEYVEPDRMVYPDAQTVPYGITLTQADDATGNVVPIPPKNPKLTCDTPGVFKVAIVDSGIDIKQLDLPCLPRNKKSANCRGRSFELSSKREKWWNAQLASHGTHVMGIIGALHNRRGVVGMVPDANICYLVARVFGEKGGAFFSTMLAAIKWAADEGADVVNLSLGGDDYQLAAHKFFDDLYYNRNVLVIGSSGNSGGTEYRYPASYGSVVSVGAVNRYSKLTSYTQRNDQVNLVAPGDSILSTVPKRQGGFVTVSSSKVEGVPASATAVTFRGTFLDNSAPTPLSGVEGRLVVCDGNGGMPRCLTATASNGTDDVDETGSFVCLIQRNGRWRFEKMALVCEKYGGSACIIYNHRDYMFTGELKQPTKVTIPVVALSGEDGSVLLKNYLNQTTEVQQQKGFGYLSGTRYVIRLWKSRHIFIMYVLHVYPSPNVSFIHSLTSFLHRIPAWQSHT